VKAKGRKESADPVVRQRERFVSYKQVFGSENGREVLFDLMNKFHILNPTDGSQLQEGERRVVLHIMSHANIDLNVLDKLLKGDM
jgi:hypothetical protein